MIGYATKTVLDTAKSTSKKVVHKTADATRELIGNKLHETIFKPKPVLIVNSKC